MRFLLQSFISFFLGVAINDLSESNTTLKTSIGKIDILETHSSFQFDLEFKTLILLIFLTTIIVISFYEKNKDRFLKSLLLKLIHFEVIFFLFIKGLNYNSFYKESQIIYVLIIILVILFIGILYKTKENDEKKEVLERLRESDIKRLNATLEISNIVGVNSVWGAGKTFLIEEWLKSRKESMYVVISVLNVEKSDILKAIFFELDKILIKKGKIGLHSSKIKSFCNNQTIFSLNLSSIFSNLTQKEAITDYKKNLESFDEKIFIIFDDLDRMDDILKIKKILNFGIEFSSDLIKVIHLYDQKKMNEYGLNREYIEKFIPINIELEPIDFFKMLGEKILKGEKLTLEVKKFEFLEDILKKIEEYEKKIPKKDTFKVFESFKFEATFRKVEIFLKEVLINIKLFKELKIAEKEIILINFLKVFYEGSFYKYLKDEENLKGVFDLTLLDIYEENLKLVKNNNDILEIMQQMKNIEIPEKLLELQQEKNVIENLKNYYELKIEHIKLILYIFDAFVDKNNVVELEKNMKIYKNIRILISLEYKDNLTEYEKEYSFIKKNILEESNLKLSYENYLKLNEMTYGKETLVISLFSKNIDEEIEKLIDVILFPKTLENRNYRSLDSIEILESIHYRRILVEKLIEKGTKEEIDFEILKRFIRNLIINITFDLMLKPKVKINFQNIKTTSELIRGLSKYSENLGSLDELANEIEYLQEEKQLLEKLLMYLIIFLNKNQKKITINLSKNDLEVQKYIDKMIQSGFTNKNQIFKEVSNRLKNKEIDIEYVKRISKEIMYRNYRNIYRD